MSNETTLRQLRFAFGNSAQYKAMNESYTTGFICVNAIDRNDKRMEYVSAEPFEEYDCELEDIKLYGREV